MNSSQLGQFWKSAGYHLVRPDSAGWLTVTPDYLRAYLTRPEIHPVEESGANEIALFEVLMADPFLAVADETVDAIEDEDARDNYRILLRFRDHLAKAGTLEGAYLAIVSSGRVDVPPVFLDQMVHVILRHILRDCRDPIRLRAAELFFREQDVSTTDGRIMLADEEIVDMYARTGGMGGLGQLLVEAATPMREVSLDVIDEDTKQSYWDRSDRFDMVVDFRFTEPGLDAFARVLESWILHFLGIATRIQPMQSIKDERWRWHIGLDAEANGLLNALYEGQEVSLDDLARIVALFRLEFRDDTAVSREMRGRPVYLGLAMDGAGKLRMKPQNVLLNLPLRRRD